MLKIVAGVTAISLLLGVAAVPASAGSGDQKAASSKDQTIDTADNERVICRKEEVIGTRLAAKKVCRTAEQWALLKQEAREGAERAQAQRSKPEGGL